jgi:AAA+ ATPase superfamily predicted ATPase
MYEEPLHLLRQGEGVRTPATYLSVLRVIAAGATQHNEIATKTTLSTANLSEKLARLRELGYVRVREPTGPAESPARGTYELADPFFRIWFRYVFPRRSRLERGLVDEVYSEIDGDLDNLIRPAFEECCRTWAGSTAGAKRLGELDEIGSWQSRDRQTEIDVVGVRRGRYELVGSCTWRRRADERVLDELINARDRMGKASRARLAIFAHGFTDGLLARASDEDVQLVTLADLFG